MNCKKNISAQIQDHVYDDVVLNGMNEYFQQNIVSELVPEMSDLFYQMLQLIDADTDISPSHRASLHIQATPAAASFFLADVFVYVVRRENKASTQDVRRTVGSRTNTQLDQTVNAPQIVLCGIAADDEFSDAAEMSAFSMRDEYSVGEYEVNIRNLYEQIASMRCVRDETIITQYGLSEMLQAMEPYVEFSIHNRAIISEHAGDIGFPISESFFDLGNLRKTYALVGEAERYRGTPDEKKKYRLLQTLTDDINRYAKLKRVARCFNDIQCIRLAIRNIGTSVAEDIRIRLLFDADSFFTPRIWQRSMRVHFRSFLTITLVIVFSALTVPPIFYIMIHRELMCRYINTCRQ